MTTPEKILIGIVITCILAVLGSMVFMDKEQFISECALTHQESTCWVELTK